MLLSLHNDVPAGLSETLFARLRNERVLERLRSLDLALMDGGAVLPAGCDSQLVSLGMELDGAGFVVDNGYGPLSLGRRTAQHARWSEDAADEAERLREALRPFSEALSVYRNFSEHQLILLSEDNPKGRRLAHLLPEQFAVARAGLCRFNQVGVALRQQPVEA